MTSLAHIPDFAGAIEEAVRAGNAAGTWLDMQAKCEPVLKKMAERGVIELEPTLDGGILYMDGETDRDHEDGSTALFCSTSEETMPRRGAGCLCGRRPPANGHHAPQLRDHQVQTRRNSAWWNATTNTRSRSGRKAQGELLVRFFTGILMAMPAIMPRSLEKATPGRWQTPRAWSGHIADRHNALVCSGDEGHGLGDFAFFCS